MIKMKFQFSNGKNKKQTNFFSMSDKLDGEYFDYFYLNIGASTSGGALSGPRATFGPPRAYFSLKLAFLT